MLPPPSPQGAPERRRDRRHLVTGQASLRPHGGGPDVFGGIVDVSAGGVRLRTRPGQDLVAGTSYDVTLEVSLPSAPQAVPPVRLSGIAVAVRAGEVESAAYEVALRYLAPLLVWDGFGGPAAIQSVPEPSIPTGV